MAMPRSLAPLLLLVTMSIISTTLANEEPTDNIINACSNSTYSAICDTVLRAYPESWTASPRGLAAVAYKFMFEQGPVLMEQTKTEAAVAARSKGMKTKTCLLKLYEDISAYVGPLTKLATPEQGDAIFTKANKDKLQELIRRPSSSVASCPGRVMESEPIVQTVFNYQKMLQVTLDLMNAQAA